ncbi:MAG TPA: hypothetical protein VN577_14815 [Terriglobales bacterium]|nr:hypothetical protein [Terriglobales bacterium]
MNSQEWLQELSRLTGIPYYPEHNIFGDKAGALVGNRDGYIVALGSGKAEGNANAVQIIFRYANNAAPKQVEEALGAAKGKFAKPKADESTARLVRTYSLGKPKPDSIKEDFDNLFAALKNTASPIAGRCEKCQTSEPNVSLMNGIPVHYCSGCQSRVNDELNAAATEYDKLDTNLGLGLIYGIVAALIGSILWGGVAYAIHYIFLYGAILIGFVIGKAVVYGVGKVTWPARAIIGVLTIASVAFGDALFYALSFAKEEALPFTTSLSFVVSNFWAIESDAKGGLLSILFGLVGAAWVMYATRKPDFKATFVPLGSPAPILAQSATAK